MSGQTQARKNYVKINIVSGLFKQTAKSLVVGETLKPLTPSCCRNITMAEKKNSGKVKVEWILMGNPHFVILKKMQSQRLNGDWWDNLILLKVQSSLQRKLKGDTDGRPCILQLEYYFLYLLYQDLYFNHFLIIHNKNELTSS